MTCDIIIPTYNNRPVLPVTLAALFAQAIPNGWNTHIIVSDDGSTDNTLASLDSLTSLPLPSPSWRLTVMTGPHTGPGGARNRALARSKADIIFFLGADILLRPGSLRAHLKFHSTNPATTDAALGMVRWDPRLRHSPFMEWMTHGGQQNAFDDLLGRLTADPRHYFYGSHLSLKRAVLPHPAFTESLAGGWEDLELGQRLADRSLTLHVLHHAIGLHRHFYSIVAMRKRALAAGENLARYQALHPHTPLLPSRSPLKHFLRWFFIVAGMQAALGLTLRFLSARFSTPRLFMVYTANQFWRGVWRSKGGFLSHVSQYLKISSKKL